MQWSLCRPGPAARSGLSAIHPLPPASKRSKHAALSAAGVERVQQVRRGETSAYVIVTSLFFAWGFITSLIDPLVASVKGIFSLSDVEAQLSASAFFIA